MRQALARIVKDANRAAEVIDEIRALIKKSPPRRDCLEIDGTIREVIGLTREEAVKNGVSVQSELVDGLPLVRGDRVQLQQVILNLIINVVEAISGISEGARELLISARKAESDGVLGAVRDSGPGLAPATLERLFESFYTTKPGGLRLGLSICRSIIEAHGGRLRACANVPAAPSFNLQCLPTRYWVVIERLSPILRPAFLERGLGNFFDKWAARRRDHWCVPRRLTKRYKATPNFTNR